MLSGSVLMWGFWFGLGFGVVASGFGWFDAVAAVRLVKLGVWCCVVIWCGDLAYCELVVAWLWLYVAFWVWFGAIASSG